MADIAASPPGGGNLAGNEGEKEKGRGFQTAPRFYQ
jgi:hypothetical protein